MDTLGPHRLAASVPKDYQAAKLRADVFYSIIARAIAQLPDNDRKARQTFYDRAREVLTSKLDGKPPSLIAYERHALEMAIDRVESLARARERAADATTSASLSRPKIARLSKLLLAILLGTIVAAAVGQFPIPWRRVLIWCCGI